MIMSYLFSASENAFYPTSLKQLYVDAGTWPEDGVDVSDEMFLIYSAMPPPGKIRGVIKGMPAWVDPPPLSTQEIIEQAEQQKAALRAAADAEIDWRQDAVDAGIATEEETAALSEWRKYRVLLMRADTLKPAWPTPPGEQAS